MHPTLSNLQAKAAKNILDNRRNSVRTMSFCFITRRLRGDYKMIFKLQVDEESIRLSIGDTDRWKMLTQFRLSIQGSER